MLGDPIFIQCTDSTNPVTVTLNRSCMVKQLELLAYSIDGAPVTAGTPNSLEYNLCFENIGVSVNFLTRNDYITGHPLRLTGVFTSEKYEVPVKILSFPSCVSFQRFQIRLKDHTGADATFTKFALWLRAT
jgi:hypothetical protein